MKNEGLKNGIIEIFAAIIIILLLKALSVQGDFVLLVGLLICLFLIYVWSNNKKRAFPVIFSKPDDELNSKISDYYDRIKFDIQSDKKSNRWITFLIVPFYLLLVLQCASYSIKYKMFGFLPVVLIVIFCVAFGIMFVMDYNVSRKLKIAKTTDFTVSKVEFYDFSYNHQGRTNYTTYYVFVRKNGESMKLKVASHVYSYVATQQNGEGYLIKNPNGAGVYDVFDFIPDKSDMKL